MTDQDLIDKVSNFMGLKVEFISDFNQSFLIGRDVVKLGIYNNPEFRLISFFHEAGHLLVGMDYMETYKYNKLMIEIEAWNKGLALAASLGKRFSDDAIAWGYSQALTYKNYR